MAGTISRTSLLLISGLFLALVLYGLPRRTGGAPTRTSESFATAVPGGAGTPQIAKLEYLAKTNHVALLELCLANYRAGGHGDYTSKFMKQERIDGKLGDEQDMDVKFMRTPFSVSLHWTRNPPPGDRVLYVDGKWNNQMLVRPAGILSWVGTVIRPPAGAEAMRTTLHPVTDFGFERSLENLLAVYRQADKAGELRQEFGGYADVGGRKTIVLVRYLPQSPKYPSYKTVTCIDVDTLVPMMIEGTDSEHRLLYRYVYTDTRFNAGLTDADFLPQANDMKDPG